MASDVPATIVSEVSVGKTAVVKKGPAVFSAARMTIFARQCSQNTSSLAVNLMTQDPTNITRLGSPYLTTEEAAQHLRIPKRTLENMRWRRIGPEYRKHGRRVCYHVDDLNAWSIRQKC